MKEAVTKVIDMLKQEDFHGALQKLLERYKCIAAGGNYFEGDLSFMCVLSIKVPIQKKSLETYLMIFVYIRIILKKTINRYTWIHIVMIYNKNDLGAVSLEIHFSDFSL